MNGVEMKALFGLFLIIHIQNFAKTQRNCCVLKRFMRLGSLFVVGWIGLVIQIWKSDRETWVFLVNWDESQKFVSSRHISNRVITPISY